ncbi:hypothetical protein T07_854 [Trichinella nelsoni]|uniref:Uncharacterized protein n=3 Tax=Trichinella TaxID=6333 RepID=A0A0V0SM48_9BILA|nr:hypothetical protein T07_854 [Trichinella nelsoni]KRY43198.1 hypothetical protein T01_5728 [Trichinella spiralis]
MLKLARTNVKTSAGSPRQFVTNDNIDIIVDVILQNLAYSKPGQKRKVKAKKAACHKPVNAPVSVVDK